MGAFQTCQIVPICWRFSQFLDFSQNIGALTEARTVTEPAREIRGGLHE